MNQPNKPHLISKLTLDSCFQCWTLTYVPKGFIFHSAPLYSHPVLWPYSKNGSSLNVPHWFRLWCPSTCVAQPCVHHMSKSPSLFPFLACKYVLHSSAEGPFFKASLTPTQAKLTIPSLVTPYPKTLYNLLFISITFGSYLFSWLLLKDSKFPKGRDGIFSISVFSALHAVASIPSSSSS